MSPRSKQQFLALREKSRERIVEATTELFSRQGFHGTSISAIAQAAKVSKGLMSNYFESKERLLDAIPDKAFMEINGPMALLLEEKDPFDRLKAIVVATFSMVKNKEDRLHWQFLMAIITQHEVVKRMHTLLTRYRRRYMATFESIFKEMGWPIPNWRAFDSLPYWMGPCCIT